MQRTGFNQRWRARRAVLICASALSGLAVLPARAATADAAVTIDIPSAPLAQQLVMLQHETARDVLFSPSAVGSVRGAALHGTMSARQAALRLVANTHLTVSETANGALVVRNAAAAQAPADPPADPPPARTAGTKTAPAAEEVVVVGSANPQGTRKIAAGYAITTLNASQIRKAIPSSTADLLKVVPGIFVETTSGVSGPNIEVRGFPTAGDAPFVTFQLDSLPIFPVPTLSFLDNSTQLRLDDTIRSVEATIGGPAVLLANGQPGATVNIIQKTGQTDPGGIMRVTTGTGSLFRIDGYYGGKIADGWYASLGGFWRTDQGVRDTQFPADQGGQVVGTLVHTIEDGKLTFYARYTHDQNAFFTPIPLISSGSGANVQIHPFPGFNPLTATFLGNANRMVTFDIAPGGPGGNPISKTVDLSQGRGIDSKVIGFDFEKDFGPFHFDNRMSYVDEDAPTIAQFTGANPETLGSFISGAVAAANADPAAVAAAGLASGGTARFVTNGRVLTNLNQQVEEIGVWDVDKHLQGFQDEARLSRDLFDGNTLTAGLYFAAFSSHDVWYLGNNQLMTVQNNAIPVAVTLNNGVLATSADGIASPVSFALQNEYDARNVAAFISDTWRINPRWRIDAGFRNEWDNTNATIGNITTENLSSNPLAIYDNGASVLTGTSHGLNFSGEASSFAVDTNYQFMKRLSGFVGFNHGYALPTFDDLRSGVTNTTYVDQAQGGFKTFGRYYSADITGFYERFQGQPTSQILLSGQQVTFITNAETEGVELDGALRPLPGLELAFSGDYQAGTYTSGGPGIQNNEVARQPNLQFRFTPSYGMPLSFGDFNAFATVTYVAQRWADLQNTQSLPQYTTLDVGAKLTLPDGIELEFTGTNVTNTLAITEGNVRVLGSGVSPGGVFLGRPLFGADYQFSAAYRF